MNALRFRIFDIAHLKAALQNRCDVKETAVDRSEDHVAHVVNVDVAALCERLLGFREVELLIELLREIALDQDALSGNERRVEVRVLAVAETQNVVGFLADLFEGLGVGRLVVAVFGVRIRDILEAEGIERRNDEFMEGRNRNSFLILNAFFDGFRHRGHRFFRNDPVVAKCRLFDGAHYLFIFKRLKRIVFL